MKNTTLLIAGLVAASAALAACGKKDDSHPIDAAVESVKDAADMRENEAAKDAVEDLESAGENAAEAVEETAEDIKKKADE